MARARLISMVALLAFTFALTSPGSAQEGTAPDWANKNGSFGVGGATTLGGTNGLQVRTYVSPLFGIEGTVGFSLSSITLDEDAGDSIDVSQNQFEFGIYGSYKLAYWQRGHLSTIFGIDLASLSIDNGTTDDSATDIIIALGLRGEVFPTSFFSIHTDVGIRIDPIGNDEVDGGSIRNTAENIDVSGLELDLMSDMIGQAGFTVWFK